MLSPTLFPMRFGQAEFCITVSSALAARARELIASHLDEAAAAEIRRLSDTLGPLEERIDYEFRDIGLLEHALTHRSRAHEDASGGVIDNESLEFLGDAVLGFVIADLLFTRFPKHSEGYKSKVKAGIVSSASLAGWRKISTSAATCCSGAAKKRPAAGTSTRFSPTASRRSSPRSISTAASRRRASSSCRSSSRWSTSAGDRAAEAAFTEDWKSAFQEWLQADGRGLPHYRIASAEGPDHRKRFDVEVIVGGQAVARASGRSKKEAEQQAAKAAMATLKPSS